LFSGFVPGTDTQSRAYRALMLRKSVLDSSLRELARLRTLAPGSERVKIDAHADAIRAVEQQLQAQLATAGDPQTCVVPKPPDSTLAAKSDSANPNGYIAAEPDEGWVEQVGKLHLALIRVAFQCDLIRVATFQWCPGNDRVAFRGMNPRDPETAYMHELYLNAMSGDFAFWEGPPPADGSADSGPYEFACNTQTWFYQKTVDALVEFKNARDAFGGSLLDHTIVPFITNEGHAADNIQQMPALIVGGKKLGMVGGQYLDLSRSTTAHNSLWLTIAQAYFPKRDPLEVLANEAFMKAAGSPKPIDGLWREPV
jgi:hypothetical protein